MVSLRLRCSIRCSCSFSSCSFRSRALSAWALAFWAAMPASRDLRRVRGGVGCAAWVGCALLQRGQRLLCRAHLEPLRAELGYLPGAREVIEEVLRDAPWVFRLS